MDDRRGHRQEHAWHLEQVRTKRLQDMEATATRLEKLTIADTNEHVRPDKFLEAQAAFAKDVFEIFKAYEEEMRERDIKLEKLWDRVTLLLWVDAVLFMAFVGVLVKGAH